MLWKLRSGSHRSAGYSYPRWLHTLVVFTLTVALLASVTPPHVFALSSGDLTFTLVTPFLSQDSNNSCAAGPKASYIEVLVTNPAGGTGALTNLTANLSAFAGSAGVTLDSGESPTRFIGSLADGASFPLYFYVNYPCQSGSNPPGITSTFTTTVSDGVTASLTSSTLTVTTRSEVSANAGGNVLSSTIGPGAVLGQIIPMTVQYDFGNPGGAQLAMIQPAGNVNFDSGCFRLMSVDITAVTGFTAGLTTSTDDQLYFTGVNGASSNTATVVYYFKMLCANVSTVANPFSDLTSGGQLKYTGNFGFCSSSNAVCPTYTAPTNPFTISKSVSPTNLPTGGTATYTVVINNPSSYATTIDSITDVLPAGVTFAAIGGASQVTAANSSSVPTAGASGTIKFQGVPTTSCVGGTCNGTYKLAANSTLTLVYTASIPNSSGSYTNSATAAVGSSSIGPSTATATVGNPAITLTKSDGNTTTTPSGTVVYALGYNNTGSLNLTGVTLSETVPANTTFKAASSTAGWSCADGAAAGTTCTYTVGSVATGATGSVNFAVAVNSGVPAGTTQISNSASVSSTQGASANASDTTSLTTAPALSLTKSDGGLSTTPGGTVVYALGYTNSGNVGLTGVALSETVPANTTFNAASSTAGWSCANGAAAGATCNLTIGALAAGAAGSANFAVNVANPVPTGTTQISNSASASASGGVTANASDTTPVNTSPALSLTKSDGGTTTTPGSVVIYTLNYQNTGNVGLTGITLSEIVPANSTFRSTGSTAGWSCANGAAAGTTCNLTIASLAGGASSSAAFAVQVVNPVSAGTTQLANSATISSGATSATASDTTPINTTPGLSITKSDGGISTTPGGSVVYTLNYQNTGNIALNGVIITEQVPGNTTFRSTGSTAGWSCANGAIAGTSCTLTVGSLAGGATGSATFAVNVITPVPAGTTQLINVVQIGNGTTSASNSDTTPVNTTPSLSLTKSDGGISASPGDKVIYTLDYGNTGNVGLTGITLNEQVPANTTFDAANSSGTWSCADGDPAGSLCTLTIGGLAGGATGTATFAVKIAGAVPAGTTQISNVATVTASGGTTATASDNTPVISSAAVSLTKSDGGASVIPGGTVAYTLNYQNTGNVNLTNLVLTETLPPNTSFNAAASSAGWSCAGATCTLNAGNLIVGNARSTIFAVTVATPLPAGATQITNNATIGNALTNASASDSTPVNATPALSLNKSDNGVTSVPGDTIVYTLDYQNTGNIGLASVVLHETIPANSSFNAASSTAGWSCVGTACTLSVPDLAAGDTGSATFAVTVDNPVPAGTSQIANSATISSGATSATANDSTPVITTPGLTLSKSDGALSAAPGGVVAYTLSYANTGNVGLVNLMISETVPANTTFDAAGSSRVWSCANGATAGTSCTQNVGALAGSANGSAIFAVKVNASLPAGVNQISNAATIDDGGSASASNSDTTPINTVKALALSKSDGGATGSPGGVIAYTLSYTNTGNVGLDGVTIAETVPANTTFDAAGSSGVWSCPNGAPAGTSCERTIGTVSGGASGTAIFAVKVVTPFPAHTAQIANSAIIAANDGTVAAASDTTAIVTTPAVSLTKSDGGSSVTPGGTVVYTLSYANIGDVDLDTVQLTETVPANTTFDAAGSSAGWSCANGSPAGSTCQLVLGDLAGGASGTVAFAVAVDTPLPAGAAQVTNSAAIADTNTGATTNASDSTPINAAPALTLTKSDGGVSSTPGGTVVYTLSYQNTGNIGLAGVILHETLPANTTFNAAASAPGWNCVGTSCDLTIGSLAAGATGNRAFAVTVANPVPAGTTQIANNASIDDGTTSASATDNTPINSTPGLTLTKSDGGATTAPGGTVAYILTYANTGNIGLSGVAINETVPANTTFNAGGSSGGWSCANSSPAGTSCTLNIGSLAGGANGSTTFAVTVVNPVPSGTTQVSNAATITDGNGNSASNSDTTPVTTSPALSLSKTDSGTSATPGSTVVYTLSYANIGNVGLSGVTIDETVPANTTFNTAGSSGGWSCANNSPAGTSCTLNIGSLAGGANGSATFAVTVVNPVPAGTTQVANSATIGDGTTSAGANRSTPVSTTPALALSKSDGGVSAVPGGTVSYNLIYTNTGNIDLAAVALTETVPANTTFNAAASSAGWSCVNGALVGTSCTLSAGSLAAGASASANFAVTVDAAVPAGTTQIANSASISGGGASANASDTTPLTTSPALSLSKSDGGVTVTPGGTVAYTLSYQNIGNIGLTGVTLSETVPAHTTFNAGGSTAGWSCANGAVAGTTCNLSVGSLAAGALGTATFAVTVAGSIPAGVTQIANSATIGDGTTSTTGGDTTPLITTPGLVLTKSDSGASTAPGGTVIYTLGYANTGNVGLTGVAIGEIVPANTTFDAAGSTAGWSCADNSPSGTSCALAIGSLAAGASGSVTFAVTVDAAVPAGISQISNAATIADGSGNSASNSDTTPVTTSPALTLTKSDGGATATPGGTAIYTLGYANSGNVGLTGVVVNETVPANTTFTTAGSTAGWSCAAGGVAGATCTFTIGALPAGASGTLTFVVVIDTPLPAGVTQITNAATASDGNGTSSSATDSTPVTTSPGLSLSKSDNNATATPSGGIVYTLSYQNTGNIGLNGVVLHEVVPANTTFDAAASAAGWTCVDGAAAGTACDLSIGSLAGGASATATFAVKVDSPIPAGVTQISNSASVGDGTTTANASDTTPVNATPALSLSKSDGGVTVTPGGTVAYTLSYQNTGNIGLTGVTIDEVVPANTTFNAAGSSGGWSCANNSPAGTSCTLTIGSLAGGANGSATFAVKVDSPVPGGTTQISNAASVTASGGTTASGSDTTPVITAPGLIITKSDGGVTTTPGGTVVYTLGYANTGNVGLTGVAVAETVPANTTFDAAGSTAGWTCADNSPAGTTCALAIGSLAASATGTATFAVTVDNPIPAGVTQISNSVTIDDGGGASASNSDTTPINATPGLSLSKSDGGVTATPGGTVTYTLSYANTGNVGLSGVVIDETVPANTTFDAAGSTAGWTCASGGAAGAACTLKLGTLAGGATGTATFAVIVDNPVAAHTSQLSNAATIDAGSASATGSATTPVTTAPAVTLAKSDGGATSTPGGTVVYTLTYANTGNVDLDAVSLSEIVPADTTFSAAGSATGWSCANGSSAGTSCTLTIGTVAGGGSGSAAFAVKVNNPLTTGGSQINNTATVADPTAGASGTASDSTPITAAPILAALKTVTDTSGGLTQPGDVLRYTITIQNTGNTVASGAAFTDAIPANTTYVAGSTLLNGAPVADIAGAMPFTSGGPINAPGALSGQIAAGATATIAFQVMINNQLPAGVTQVSNQALVSANAIASILTNNPGTPAAGDPTTIAINNPTAIALASFTAVRSGSQVVVRWTTTAELNTLGFELYRSANGRRADAVRVTPALIAGRGRGQGGASYSWIDTSAADGATYTYWLIEIEVSGTTNEYGPTTAEARTSGAAKLVYLPVIVR
jgi:uncharacterized repeat protein (TIGR01451 family)